MPHLPAPGARCSGRASLLVTTLPFLRTTPIHEFSSKDDLINVVMASAHIPVLIDWRMFVLTRRRACVDGGLWWLFHRSEEEYTARLPSQTMIIRPTDDPALLRGYHTYKGLRASDHGLAHEMLALGEAYAGVLAGRWGHALTPRMPASHPTGCLAGMRGFEGVLGQKGMQGPAQVSHMSNL